MIKRIMILVAVLLIAVTTNGIAGKERPVCVWSGLQEQPDIDGHIVGKKAFDPDAVYAGNAHKTKQ